MKMDRNLNEDGLGKYALINLRRLSLQGRTPEVENALQVLKKAGVLELGCVGDEDEFFPIKLKDINAKAALCAYAASAEKTDLEWAKEVREMAERAGENSRFCKIPD